MIGERLLMMSDFRGGWGSEMTPKNRTLEGKNRTLEGKNRTLGGNGGSKLTLKNQTLFMYVPYSKMIMHNRSHVSKYNQRIRIPASLKSDSSNNFLH